MRAAALQFFATPFDLARNLDTAERLAREAAAQGARLIVLPACFNTGYVYSPRLPAAAETESGPTTAWLKRLSAELNVWLGGAMLRQVGARVVNTLVLAEPGGSLHLHQQQRPRLWENHYFTAGAAPQLVTTALGRVGLLIGWDLAQRPVLDAYQGQVELLVMSSALPRFHRAVLNFPLGRKIYLAQLMPSLLRQRAAIDDELADNLTAGAECMGAPLIHAALAGRFVSELPRPRLSFGLMALSRPRHWPLAWQAEQASLRATFVGGSAIVSASGKTVARVEADEGLALADVTPGPTAAHRSRPNGPRQPLPWRVLTALLKR